MKLAFSLSLLLLLLALCIAAFSDAQRYTTHDLTEKQRAALEKFKKRVSSITTEEFMKSDLYLLRFLAAKNYDVDEAETFFKEHVAWRMENKMMEIASEDLSEMSKLFPYEIMGKDKMGRPLLLMDFGKWGILQWALAGKLDRLLRYYDRMLNDAFMKVRLTQEEGMKNVTQWVWIVNQYDTADVDLLVAQFYVHAVTTLEKHFPKMTSSLLLINSPEIFNSVVELILRPGMTEETNKSFKTYRNSTQWMPVLSNMIDATELPKSYGGTKE